MLMVHYQHLGKWDIDVTDDIHVSPAFNYDLSCICLLSSRSFTVSKEIVGNAACLYLMSGLT